MSMVMEMEMDSVLGTLCHQLVLVPHLSHFGRLPDLGEEFEHFLRNPLFRLPQIPMADCAERYQSLHYFGIGSKHLWNSDKNITWATLYTLASHYFSMKYFEMLK